MEAVAGGPQEAEGKLDRGKQGLYEDQKTSPRLIEAAAVKSCHRMRVGYCIIECMYWTTLGHISTVMTHLRRTCEYAQTRMTLSATSLRYGRSVEMGGAGGKPYGRARMARRWAFWSKPRAGVRHERSRLLASLACRGL